MYILAGAASGVVYFAVLWAGRQFLNLNIPIAHTLAYVASVGAHFGLNHHVTFPEKGRLLGRTVIRYCLMLAFGYAFMLAIVHSATNILYLPLLVASIVAVAFNALASYQLSKHWVFRSRSSCGDDICEVR